MPANLIYDGIVENIQRQTLPFDASGFCYFVSSVLREVNVQFDLTVDVGQTRIIPLCGQTRKCKRVYPVWTDEIVEIPCSVVGSGLSMQLTLTSFFGSFNVQVYHQPVVSKVEEKIDNLIATQIIRTAIDLVVPLLTGGLDALIVPAISGALRGGLQILNPAAEPVYIGLGNSVSVTDYDRILPPGASLSIDGWQGAVSAIAPNGGNVALQVTEFTS